MNCLDCTVHDHHDRPAVGTCHHCGAGICIDHVELVGDHLTRIEPLNRVVTVDPPARRLRCHTCHTALTAAAPSTLGRRRLAAC